MRQMEADSGGDEEGKGTSVMRRRTKRWKIRCG